MALDQRRHIGLSRRDLSFLVPGMAFAEYGKVIPVDRDGNAISFQGDWGDYMVVNNRNIDVEEVSHLMQMGCACPIAMPEATNKINEYGYGKIPLKINGGNFFAKRMIERDSSFAYMMWASYPGRMARGRQTSWVVMAFCRSPIPEKKQMEILKRLGDVTPWHYVVKS